MSPISLLYMVCAFLASIESIYSAPQYFQDGRVHSMFYYTPGDLRVRGADYAYPVDVAYMPWFNLNSPPYPLQPKYFLPSDWLSPASPPMYDWMAFEGSSNPVTRGRGDMEPADDDYDDVKSGYFYPRPIIPFELPRFTPLSADGDTSDVGDASQESVNVASATENCDEDMTATMTTVMTPTTTTVTTSTTSDVIDRTSQPSGSGITNSTT